MKQGILWLMAAAALTACGDRDERYERPMNSDGPHSIGGAIHFLARGPGRLIRIDADKKTISHYEVGKDPGLITANQAGKTLFVIDQDRKQLHVFNEAGDQKKIALKAAYTRISFTPSSQQVICSFTPGQQADSASSLGAININQIEIVNLANASTMVETLVSGALGAERFVFSNNNPDGVGPSAAAAVTTAGLTFFDFADPKVRRVSIPLSLPDGSRIQPQEVWFSADNKYVFIRAASWDEIITLTLNKVPLANDPSFSSTIQVNINFMSSRSRGLTALRPLDGGRVLAAYSGSSEVVIYDAGNAGADPVIYGGINGPVSWIEPLSDGAQTYYFLLAAGRQKAYLLNAANGAFDAMNLQPLSSQIPSPNGRTIVLIGASGLIRLVKAETRTGQTGSATPRLREIPIQVNAAQSGFVFGNNGDALFGLFRKNNENFSRLLTVDLNSGAPGEAGLDEIYESLGVTPSGHIHMRLKRDKGTLAVMPPGELTKDRIWKVGGYLYHGVFDPAEPEGEEPK
ncbi:MAG: hypothetical protein GMKNLPBB_01946 [Myxococcota bacterium]|nr:hypothetical protein [Myxococcota bacterium]